MVRLADRRRDLLRLGDRRETTRCFPCRRRRGNRGDPIAITEPAHFATSLNSDDLRQGGSGVVAAARCATPATRTPGVARQVRRCVSGKLTGGWWIPDPEAL